jgi:AmiR/NasT family two-component response regulator
MARDRVLIVEDNIALEGRPLERALQKAGYEVIGIADTETSAVELATRHRPSVVLMDIELVDTDRRKDRLAGLRAARRIQTSTGAQIIFITGILAEPTVLSEAQKTQCEFLVKPVREEQLLASVQLAVARAKRKDIVFVCYSKADNRFAEEMMKHLEGLRWLGIRPWIDTQIDPGGQWETEINNALAEAKYAVCLVSSNFIASTFIKQVELPSLLRAQVERGLRVFPIFVNFVHPTILKPLGLLDFQGINQPDKPIAKWPQPKRHQYCWGLLCRCLHSE